LFQNHFTLVLRKLAKHKDYTFLNIFGLALSIGCSILIFVLLRHHLSFDTYHRHAASTMRIVMDVKTEEKFPFSGTPLPMAEALRLECPLAEVVAMRREEDEVLISIANDKGDKDKYLENEAFAWVEPSYFDILDLPVLQGDLGGLKEPNTVVLTQILVKKYFGEADPIGKTITVNNEQNLRIVGVLKDLPKNTDYKQGILASWASLKADTSMVSELRSWGGASGGNFCFLRLKPGHEFAEMDAVMATFRENHPHPDSKDLFQYKALPLLGMHCDTDYGFGVDASFLWALGLIGFFLLITACVNFVNMATAQALTRGREVGVRKALGSTRGQLFWQFIGETGLIVVAALVVGFVLAWMALPFLNAWLNMDLTFDGPLMGVLLVFSLLLGVVLTFLAGLYPGLMQSRFNPVVSLRSQVELPGKGQFSLRKVLVTTQFFISQVLIIGAAVVSAQMRFAQEVNWGFKPGAVVTLEIPEQNKMKTLKGQLSQIAGVKSVSLCYQPPASTSNNFNGINIDNRKDPEPWLVNDKAADAQYLETFSLKLVAGRNLSESDTVREYVVNRTFVKRLNLENPEAILGKYVHLGGAVNGQIVGVVEDFHNWNVSQAIAPIILSTNSGHYGTCAIQLAPGNPKAVLEQIKKTWESIYPNQYYKHQFMDERLAELMDTELIILRLINTFAGIAIFIGCLGLYGLAAFLIARKRKEVGIRKTLGASIGSVLWLFGKEYIRLITIAFVLAVPLAWWVMDSWLQNYAYRINIGLGVFLLSLLITIGIALLTVGVQSVRAALANPVKSLSSE
jgi:putative ABC transport system permease protein